MDGDTLVLYAPNRFNCDWVRINTSISLISSLLSRCNAPKLRLILVVVLRRPVASTYSSNSCKPVNRQTKAQVGTTFNVKPSRWRTLIINNINLAINLITSVEA